LEIDGKRKRSPLYAAENFVSGKIKEAIWNPKNMSSQYDIMLRDPQVLKNGQTVTFGSKLDFAGTGAGFLYTGSDWMLHFAPQKPAQFDERYMFQLEKPPQKSGGNPDLNIIYDGDDVLVRSIANGRYIRFITNYGGTNMFHVNADEHFAKYEYRTEGAGTMEAFRIVATGDGAVRGEPVIMDGKRTYALVNPRSIAYISASPYSGVRSAANAGDRESWFITDTNGGVPPSLDQVSAVMQ